MKDVVLDEAGVLALLARLSARPATPASPREPEFIWDAEDLHDADRDADLHDRLPVVPSD